MRRSLTTLRTRRCWSARISSLPRDAAERSGSIQDSRTIGAILSVKTARARRASGTALKSLLTLTGTPSRADVPQCVLGKHSRYPWGHSEAHHGSDSRDALLVGFYEGSELRFAARVRAGFIPRVRREIVEKLTPLRRKVSFRESARRQEITMGRRHYSGRNDHDAVD